MILDSLLFSTKYTTYSPLAVENWKIVIERKFLEILFKISNKVGNKLNELGFVEEQLLMFGLFYFVLL